MPDEAGHFLWMNSICRSLAGIDDLWRRGKKERRRLVARQLNPRLAIFRSANASIFFQLYASVQAWADKITADRTLYPGRERSTRGASPRDRLASLTVARLSSDVSVGGQQVRRKTIHSNLKFRIATAVRPRSPRNSSGVTKVGVTWCGNWWCDIFPQKSDDLFSTWNPRPHFFFRSLFLLTLRWLLQ